MDELDHPILTKATEQFADDDARHERVRAIDDQILFKVKVQRWRGAVWPQGDLPWLIAAGHREEGSGDDFYAALEDGAKAARARYNREHAKSHQSHTYIGHLLPEPGDYERYRMESGRRLLRQLTVTIADLVRASLRDGHEHSVELGTFRVGIQIRADDGHETYAAVRITGSVPDNIAFLILDLIPGCDRDTWMPELRLPDRALHGAEQAWSTLMDPYAAAKLLDHGL